MLPIRWPTALSSRRKAIFALLALLVLPALPHHASAQTGASDRIANNGTGVGMTEQGKALHATSRSTRFVIHLERDTEFQVSSLNNPPRVLVDLPDVRMKLPVMLGRRPIGLVRSFRGGLFAPGKARVVIDVTEPVIVDKAVMKRAPDGRSSRLILDIISARPLLNRFSSKSDPKQNSWRASLGGALSALQPPLPRRAPRPGTRAAKLYKPVIVLDPGHGGHDSGAKKYGTIEKEVVLAFGRTLRDKLTKSGRYRVLMTRDDDTFVDLDERREFAERHKAALFIAIHADYANKKARGATIYSLRESVAKNLKRSATGEVRDHVLSSGEMKKIKASSGNISVVKGFLADLAQREVEATSQRTSMFTRSVIQFMGRSTNLKDNPDRSATFVVLKTAKVPAVLIELAYVTNRQDARNLKSRQWRNKVSGSIMTAIDNYFTHQMSRLPM